MMSWRMRAIVVAITVSLWGAASANTGDDPEAESRAREEGAGAAAEVAQATPPSQADPETTLPPVPTFEPVGAPAPKGSIGGATRGGHPEAND